MRFLRNLLLLITFVAVFSSCDREPDRPDYYYRFKVNGVQKEFRANTDSGILFLDDPNEVNRYMLFNMTTGRDNEKNSLFISLRTLETITIGTRYEMQLGINVNNQVVPRITVLYFDENGDQFIADLLQRDNPGARDDAWIVFDELIQEGSYGRFEATIFSVDDDGELSERQDILITDGEFFIPNFISLR
ncbi:hypothetical protein A33Q_3537 [Indibacter alkaliphilus LW1]|uniref:Uncharacterized protein n=1 Tax=Indibacter alkaliphilus (strain CCUG 57479 / KCTC 22604 / LW1) TaxID=1189612 RepID=S2DNT0_INDAL|nr:hypothetical protein [Indibacter alkaliphilus]EOZ93591.1 hypothetical protein A33Q_3537 [Indibacter alkaliphilus LW1]